MTFHLLSAFFSSPQFCLIPLFVSMSSRASMNSHVLSIRSSLSSAKEAVYEKTDGLRWSDVDPTGWPNHRIWVYLRLKWSLFLLVACPAFHKQSLCLQPDSPLVPCSLVWSGGQLEIYNDLHTLMGMPCLLPTGRSSDPLCVQ